MLERWVAVSPSSFKGLNFAKSYIDAGDKMLSLGNTNAAVNAYIKAYQVIDKNYELKVDSAYKASFLLYAQQKRNEALFYINRAVENLARLGDHPLLKDIFYLKRRIVWRYFSRLDSLPDNAISAVKFDGDDVWIGMWSGGLGRFSRSQSQLDLFNIRNTELPSNYIRDILVMDDKIWIATHEGLAYYQKNDATWHRVDSMQNYKFKTIGFEDGYYYTSTLFNGVFRSADGVEWENIIPKQNVLDIFNSGGDIYVATPESGVLLYRDGALSRFLPGVSAKTIIEDPAGRHIWIGTYGDGLLKVDKRNGAVSERYGSKDISSDYVESLLVIDGKLWIGTLEGGLSIYSTDTKKWEKFILQDGLPGLDITVLTQENDHVWMGTLAGGIGIYKFQ